MSLQTPGPTQLPVQWVQTVLFTGVKWLERDAKHSSLSSTTIKYSWSFISTPPMSMVLMQRCNFNSTFVSCYYRCIFKWKKLRFILHASEAWRNTRSTDYGRTRDEI